MPMAWIVFVPRIKSILRWHRSPPIGFQTAHASVCASIPDYKYSPVDWAKMNGIANAWHMDVGWFTNNIFFISLSSL